MSENEAVIRGYEQMVEERVRGGWEPTLLTFTFDALPGSPEARWEQMADAIDHLYRRTVTEVVRNPKSPKHAWKRPIWIVCPDFPINRRDRFAAVLALPNDGQHAHAVELMPPVSRRGESLSQYIVGDGHASCLRPPFSAIDAEPITSRPGFVVDYVMKAFKRGRVCGDALLILPHALSEVRDDRTWAGNALPRSRPPVAVGAVPRRRLPVGRSVPQPPSRPELTSPLGRTRSRP